MTNRCFASHMGYYLMEPVRFRATVSAALAGLLPERAPPQAAAPGGNGSAKPFALESGIAHIPISGTLFKGFSKFAESDTTEIRRQVRAASRDDDVRGILLHIDSPGGIVDGTADLAADVRAADGVKPVHAFIEDLGASAAYWVAAGARRISASPPTTHVGSIGIVAVVDDISGQLEKDGIVTHVLSTGKFKGMGIAGAPVTDEHLAAIQADVDGIMEHFSAAVSAGRGLVGDALDAVSDGRTFIAADALDLGLVDALETVDDAVDAIRTASAPRGPGRRERAEAELRVRSRLL